MLRFFFRRGPSASRQAYLLGRASFQGGGQFLASACYGVFVETGDSGHYANAAVSDPLCFDGGIPAPLLFVEAAEEQVDLFMQDPLGMVGFLLTVGTLTTM